MSRNHTPKPEWQEAGAQQAEAQTLADAAAILERSGRLHGSTPYTRTVERALCILFQREAERRRLQIRAANDEEASAA